MKTTILSLLVATAITAPPLHATQAAQQDWLIIPGERVGPITTATTEDALRVALGASAVSRDSIYWFEGQYRPGTVLYAQDSTRRVEIIWKDEKRRARPETVRISGRRSQWHTADSLTLGTSFEVLERLNGRAFRIGSSCCDYAGHVWSWERGALEGRFRMLEVWLSPLINTDEPHPFSSDSAVKVRRPIISELIAHFPD